MKNKLIKSNKSWVIAMLFILPLSLVGLTGCNSKEVLVSQVEDTNVEQTAATSDTIQDGTGADSQKETLQESGALQGVESEDVQEDGTQQNTVKEESEASQDTNTEVGLSQLIKLLGLSKDELKNNIKEEPQTVDEGGLEFADYGIRVWFNDNSKVNQIYLLKNNFDLNGVKNGDKISSFKKVFGDPVKDDNGDAHFKYGDIFLSVNYDTTTEQTYGIYILTEDF